MKPCICKENYKHPNFIDLIKNREYVYDDESYVGNGYIEVYLDYFKIVHLGRYPIDIFITSYENVWNVGYLHRFCFENDTNFNRLTSSELMRQIIELELVSSRLSLRDYVWLEVPDNDIVIIHRVVTDDMLPGLSMRQVYKLWSTIHNANERSSYPRWFLYAMKSFNRDKVYYDKERRRWVVSIPKEYLFTLEVPETYQYYKPSYDNRGLSSEEVSDLMKFIQVNNSWENMYDNLHTKNRVVFKYYQMYTDTRTGTVWAIEFRDIMNSKNTYDEGKLFLRTERDYDFKEEIYKFLNQEGRNMEG